MIPLLKAQIPPKIKISYIRTKLQKENIQVLHKKRIIIINRIIMEEKTQNKKIYQKIYSTKLIKKEKNNYLLLEETYSKKIQ